MTRERWEEVVSLIEAKFGVESREDRQDEFDQSVTESLVFECGLGKIKLEFISKPKVIDKKVSYSNRLGAQSQVEYIYSSTEKNEKLLVYRLDEASDNWLPMSLSSMNLF